LRVDEHQRHARLDLLRMSVNEHLAGMFAGRNIDDREQERTTDLLGGEPNAVGCIHGFDHVGGELAELGRDLFDPRAFLAQNWVSIFSDFQDHGNIIAKKQSVAKPDTI
jgi:hypothetical protein